MPERKMADICRNCGYSREANDAHFGISHYPFSRAHAFEPEPEIPDEIIEEIDQAIMDGPR